MDDGKPSGPRTKWWNRPSTGRAHPAGPEDAVPAPGSTAGTGQAPAAGPAESPAPPATGQAEPGMDPAAEADESFRLAPPAPGPGPRAEPVADPSEPARAEPPAPAAPPGPPPAGVPQAGPPVPSAPAEAAVAAGEPAPRPRPLHPADEYSTPPYGEPGPWAPAPPVQRPVPTPAHGTPVPPPYAGPHGPGAPPHAPPAEEYPPPGAGFAPPSAAHTLPHQQAGSSGTAQQPAPFGQPDQPAPFGQPGPAQHQPRAAAHPQQTGQWLRYDPWGAPRPPHQPLSAPDSATAGQPRRSRRGALLAGAVLLALVAGGIGGGVGAYVERNGGLTTVELPQAGRDSGGRAPDSVAGIASRALPSVVTLHVSGAAESGTGTGFVLDAKGHILTNNHVVAPAGTSGDITVTFSGGETASAEIVGQDSGYDLAVVKVTGVSGLAPLPLGNSDNVQVGDPVVAIGAPFDLSNTVTSGIISAKQRPITAGGEKGDGSDVSYVDALQTDAPINPGNSGGPLVDTEARVIGINSAIRAAGTGSGSDSGQSGSIGLGFAIPINQAKRVAEELINTGKATHPVIGVTLDMQFTGDGARVGGKAADGGPAVTEGGPADRAGIRTGDVITEVQGQRVHSGEELIIKIRAHRPGDRLDLRLIRGGKDLSMTLTLGSASGT
ncbi:PDZ domain-containing protein [Streptomyces nitrosporeus]|uniref:PDZ domain-containing protein n=1 Tax=Streptomyces nitrosporeus TaxID=28894 RepID=A0A5J6FC06_9ACTN|nr:trypsin-like peptidase domain-containing protein [Streptomyces nitrosporeus]QEU72500.1 PDZ domain-containing protein [Streptomyces nitrosporeus]GGY77436.1 protease [Streptomyces nitrosporeus]